MLLNTVGNLIKKDMVKADFLKIQEYQNENKHLLIMVADPQTDSISISYGGYNAFVRFPMESMDKGVIFNALRESKFEEAIGPFITGLSEASGISGSSIEGANVLKTIGGAIKNIGSAKEIEKRKFISKKLK